MSIKFLFSIYVRFLLDMKADLVKLQDKLDDELLSQDKSSKL